MPKTKTSTDWRTLIEQDALAPRVPDDTLAPVAVPFTLRGLRLVRRAARQRRMSVNAYIRRAAIAFATHDLHESWDAVMRDEPGFNDGVRNMGRAPMRPAGHGFGPWLIMRLTKHYSDD